LKISFPEVFIQKSMVQGILRIPREKVFERAALAAILLIAGLLRFDNLDRLGYVNHYYAAAMISMQKSWHNFFFLAAEPGGAVSVDKPPVGLWLQAASTSIFGVNTVGLLIPELLAGLASVIVLYYLVRSHFGVIAGLFAALALAITPIMIATDRNNTIDSILILTLLLAAWAFIKATFGSTATDTRKFSFLLLGTALIGIGFNIKMLAALLPLPAFYGMYLLASSEPFWRKAGKLLLASILLLVVSLSWVTIVDLTPASQRPYIGSSGDNNEMSLIIGYNGMDRLLGMFGRGFRTGGQAAGFRGGSFPGNSGLPANGQNNNRGFGSFNPGRLPGVQAGGSLPIQAGNSGTAGGSVDMGQSGALRLLLPPLSKNASWLLPLAIAGLLGLVINGLISRGRLRLSWPIAPEHAAAVLWGGWLLIGVIFFSIAQFFHEYYLSLMGPPIAALAGIAVGQFWALRKQHLLMASILLGVTAAGTLAFQVLTASPYISSAIWLPLALILLASGAILWIIARRAGPILQIGFACILASILIAPGFWSLVTNVYPSENQSLPSVYSGQSGAAADLRGLNVNPALLAYLEAHTNSGSYLLAVPSSMQGSDYAIATGRPVLYLGGFMGIDQVLTPDQLSLMVQQGKLRYIYWDTQGRGMDSQVNISNWVSSNCTVVPGFEAVTQNSGAPGGIGGQTSASNNGSSRGFGAMQVSLYDCGSSN
jgi:4-amino-4-deoxy-L-arabinose transferase-like glycosyltransferase